MTEKKKLVLIKWLDSKSGPMEWEHLNDLEPLKPIICVSVGFLIEETHLYKTLAPTMGGGQTLGRVTIPACSIIKFQEIKLDRLAGIVVT